MTADELRRRRAHAQLLHRPPGVAPAAIVEHLLAVQAQDPSSFGLALRVRGRGLRAADLDRLLSPRPALVIGWLGRGTLHLVSAGDYPWLLGLTAPGRLANSRRRLAQEGLTPTDVDRGVTIIERALAADGPLTRPALADRIDRAGIRAAGQAIVHLIILTALTGIAIPAGGTDHRTFALTDDWIGARPPARLDGEERDVALTELARRYLRAHGPARPRDLARWAGLPVSDADRGLDRIARELVRLPGDLVDLASPDPSDPATATPVDRRYTDPASPPLPAGLLPAFDPYMLGWEDRTFAVAAAHARRVHPGGGMLRAVACHDGLAVGTWAVRRRPATLAVELEPFDSPEPDVERALLADAADVARFEDRRLV
jgi:Winged helix DNA-binding domain